jgi:hypothetical protein
MFIRSTESNNHMHKNDAILVATSTDAKPLAESAYAKELAEISMWRDQERLERDMRAVGFGRRESVCG